MVATIPELLDQIRELADELERDNPPPAPPPDAVVVVESSYSPWGTTDQPCTQKHFYRSSAVFRILVAGRQAGKTQAAAAELLDVMCWKPGSFSVLLAPTYQIARAAIRKVLELAAAIPGYHLSWWKTQKKELHLPNGSVWAVFSADRKESVRGPTINGLLWVDEGAYLSDVAWTAALGALGAVQDARVVVTTTPVGKNWVHQEFVSEDEDTESFTFRTEDSPYCNRKLVAKLRLKMSAERAAQEFDAEFVDNLLLAFPDTTRLFVDGFPAHSVKAENVLGIDLGKEQDWCVVTLMNQWGEATPLGRWQHVKWPVTTRRIKNFSKRFNALCVLDKGYGYGSVLGEYLEEEGVEVLLVSTNSIGTKAQIVEQTKADVQWEKISVLETEFSEQFRHELSRFQGIKRVIKGQEINVYEGPQIPGEHDDCVI
ncbi:terminase family protein, partial [Planctomycetota bacterium]|nr:terminase family protein [Planctomycetota bacterium]